MAARLPLSDEPDSSEDADDANDLRDAEEDDGGRPSWPQSQHRARRQRCREVLAGTARMGAAPADLVAVLGRVAVASPANCALRALMPAQQAAPRELLQAARASATVVAIGFVRYLAHRQARTLLAALSAERFFWQQALWYCGIGCMQATLDEYVNVLGFDHPTRKDAGEAETCAQRAQDIFDSLRLRPAVLSPERLVVVDGRGGLERTACTLRYARPLLEDKADASAPGSKAATTTPLMQLRGAFNSPFLPFVLCSTSIGQEGLDFHWYCHAIVHWNLPPNPVDFEQRDGRIHRFRNHAVRRNIAHDWGGRSPRQRDPTSEWRSMFAAAAQCLIGRDAHMQGMKPSWIYRRGEAGDVHPAPAWARAHMGDAAMIERLVPGLAFSKDSRQLLRLTQAVGRYRMVFGQPRQEDLLAHLAYVNGGELLRQWSQHLAIDLRPPEMSSSAPDRPGAMVDFEIGAP